jgi:ATP-dependent Clp protease ATP-binding subunit ClpA
MNFYELKRKDSEVYAGILVERVLRKNTRKRIRSALFYGMVTAFFFVILALIGNAGNLGENAFFSALVSLTYFFRSVFVLLFSLWFAMYLIELMYLSYYFKDTKIDFDVLSLVNTLDPKDITKSFLETEIGQYALVRLGITKGEVKRFYETRTDFVTAAEYEIVENDDDRVSFAEFGFSLVHFDSDFSKLLKTKGITARDFHEVLEWITRINNRVRDESRWWTRESLARIPSIGKGWAFGQTYHLDRFGHTIYKDTAFYHLGDKWRLYTKTINDIENILVKDRGANVMLTSREAEIGLEAVASLGKEIIRGTVLPELENKRLYVLDINLLVSTFEDKSAFEIMLQKILYQSASAGNIILAIPNFSDFVENAKNLGTDVKDLLNEVMSSTRLQIIAISNTRGFHEVLETDLDLMRNFEKIVLEDLDEKSAIEFIEDEAQILESREKIIFTYQALKRIVESADRYFSESSISDKATDILNEVATYCLAKKLTFITDECVAEVVEAKTGVPLGVLSKSEKEKLSNIEMLLKRRVVGQDRALESISEALKRARLGVANPKRPLGSFLFIGPTGVGKTETSKALANVFFGEDEDMIRIDMSEFSDDAALTRLIGDRDNPGILSSKIREKQYGVLLVDEFEKAHPEVHNLFLQVLDEGFFSDGIGEKVNTRNLIIIATSNAGSDLMYRAMEKNINLQSIKEKVIGYLVKEKLFRPEFLNRFDEVILFNSLPPKVLQTIASLMINKLNKRLEDKGVDVKVTDDLTDYLVQKGQDLRFGAREINRVIQKDIEAEIADALISGDIDKGDTITFVKSGSADASSGETIEEIEIRKII